MAGLKRCLGIDLGSSRIKVAEIVAEKGRLRLNKVLQADVDVPPGTDEDERGLRLSRALRDMLKANKITTKDAVFCVPGHAVFQRPVKLPKTSPERLRRIIEYEARQQIPFPLEQTSFEYQVFEDPQNQEEVEVLLAAIKRDTIQSHVRLFRRAGLRVAGIGVSYFALFNYHLFDQGKIIPETKTKADKSGDKKVKDKKATRFSFGKKDKVPEPVPAEQTEELPDEDAIPDFEDGDVEAIGEDGGLDEIKAYVNLGATSMDLAIPKSGNMGVVGFCRTIPHAGNEMTKAIQTALALDSFREAEEVKLTQAAVLSTMYDLAGGGDATYNRKASEALTQVVERRIIGELRRSLDFYISQPDGVAVDALVLSGGQAHLPYLGSYIEEKLGIPVEVVEEFHNEDVPLGDGMESADWASAAVAVGLAVQGVGVSPIRVDFLPREMRTVREFKGRYREVAAMVAVLAGMIYLSSGIGKHEIQMYRDAANMARGQIDTQAEVAKARFTEVQNARQPIIDRMKGLIKLAEPRTIWLEFLAEILREKPSEVVLNTVQMGADGQIYIAGECATLPPIQDFLDNLAKRRDLVLDVASRRLDPEPLPDPLNRFKHGTHVFEFTMRHATKHVPIKATPTPTPVGMPVR